MIKIKFLSVLVGLFFCMGFTYSQTNASVDGKDRIGKVNYAVYSNPRKCTLTDTTAVLYLHNTHSLFVYAKGNIPQLVNCDQGEDVLLLEPKGNMIYKNYQSDSLKIRELVVTTVYQSKEEMPEFDWVLGTKEKQLGNYKVKNATTTFRGRNFEVWFTEEIPISDGPWKFNGLPGLILEAYDTEKDYVFTMKSIQIPANTASDEVAFSEDGQFLPITEFLKADILEFEKIKKQSEAASNVEVEVKMPPRNPIELSEN
jgi:GLPGLI family protein